MQEKHVAGHEESLLLSFALDRQTFLSTLASTTLFFASLFCMLQASLVTKS
jgi:hypothetical protein